MPERISVWRHCISGSRVHAISLLGCILLAQRLHLMHCALRNLVCFDGQQHKATQPSPSGCILFICDRLTRPQGCLLMLRWPEQTSLRVLSTHQLLLEQNHTCIGTSLKPFLSSKAVLRVYCKARKQSPTRRECFSRAVCIIKAVL